MIVHAGSDESHHEPALAAVSVMDVNLDLLTDHAGRGVEIHEGVDRRRSEQIRRQRGCAVDELRSFRDRDVAHAIGITEPERARVLHISNTLHLGELLASEVFLPMIETRDDLDIVEDAREMEFDEAGNLYPVEAATAGVH